MSDPLSLAVLSLFQVSARTAQCDASNTNAGPPFVGTQSCTAGLLGRNRRNSNFGGTQTNSAGRGTTGSNG